MSDDVLSTVLGMLTKEQKEELVAKLITDVGNLQTEEQKEEVINPVSSPRKVNEDFTVTNSKSVLNTGKQAVKAKGNTWTDTGEKRDPDYDASKFEAMGRKARPTESRIKKITKQCCVCNKSFEIAAGLVYGKFYRCDRCTG